MRMRIKGELRCKGGNKRRAITVKMMRNWEFGVLALRGVGKVSVNCGWEALKD